MVYISSNVTILSVDSLEEIITGRIQKEIDRLELNYPNFHIYRIQKLKKKLLRIKTNLKEK